MGGLRGNPPILSGVNYQF